MTDYCFWKKDMYTLRRVIFSILIVFIVAAAMPPLVYAKQKSSSSQKEKDNSDEINREIEKNQDAISDAQAEKDKLKSGMNDVQKVIDSLESQKGNLESYVNELDKSLLGIQDEISELNGQISDYDEKIDLLAQSIVEKKKEIEAAKSEVEKAGQLLNDCYDRTKEHIKYMYQRRKSTYWDLLLGSRNFGDFLNRTMYVESMSRYDDEQLQEYALLKENLEKKEQELEQSNKELEDMRLELEEDRQEVNDQKAVVAEKESDMSKLIAAKEQEIDVYESDISSKEEQIKEYKDMIASQDAVIKALEAAIAQQRQQLEGGDTEESGSGLPKYDGGKFTFPAPSYTRVSDDYGNRIHPTLGVEQFHNGIDLAAPSGSPILAAYDGQVVAADYSSTMGNYIMIDHGDNLYTIYMHSSSLLVSKGQSVSKGQKIALVGSTGRSTGPHLHFSVRSNGSYVSPWNYLK